MAGILNIGISALLTYQRALATTGHNVANVNTPGYSRQTVDLTTQIPQQLGEGYVGSGVRIAGIKREYDDFLAAQVRSSESATAELDIFYRYAVQIDNVIADPDVGLDPALQDFFDAMQGLADDPGSVPVRELLLSESDSLADRFHDLQRFMESAEQRLNTDVGIAVDEVNRLASVVAEVNTAISRAGGAQSGIEPNDLLDRRDHAILEMSKYVNITTLVQDDGAVNVYFGKGQALVLGGQVQTLSVVDSQEVPGEKDIAYGTGAAASGQVVTNLITGGELGGLLRVREEILDAGRLQIGLVAVGLSHDINAQHRLGVNLLDQTDLDYFTDIDTSISIRNRGNDATSDYQFNIAVTDPALLSASDYRLVYNGGGAGDPHNYTLTRLSDRSIISPDPLPADAAFPWDLTTKEGLSIAVDPASTTIVAGDSFLIRPTADAAGQIKVDLTDAREIAAAGMLRSETLPSNTGTATLSQPSVVTASNIPLEQIELTYDGANFVVDVPASIAPAPGPFAYAGPGPTVISMYGFDVTVSGAPAIGDRFYISGGVSDNRNALAMADLQSSNQMLDGSATYQDSFGNFVATTGSKTRQADLNLQAQEGLLEVNREAFQSIAGVNLDEEAANLVRYQQAYQAAAQVINSANVVFDALLQAVR